MRVLIDIGHPAHVHYFKNFATRMIEAGHSIGFTVRNREGCFALMDALGFEYARRGRGGKTMVSKLLRLPLTDIKVLRVALRFRPDMLLSFGSPYAAHVSRLLNRPHVAFDDTEHAVLAHKLYRPFTDVIWSPSCYLGEVQAPKQRLFDSYMELAYLHPEYFTLDSQVADKLGLSGNEQFALLRFVSWNASHDRGHTGLTREEKIALVTGIARHCRVFISSEGEVPPELRGNVLRIHPSELHDVLRLASLYIGEGATTATESAMLGTPAIYTSGLKVGTCSELEEQYGLVFQKKNVRDILEKAENILNNPEARTKYEQRRQTMLTDKIDTTKFMTNWISHYGAMRGRRQRAVLSH